MKFAQLSVNQHYFGDNLQVLREHLVPESVYLIYLDPLYKFARSAYNLGTIA